MIKHWMRQLLPGHVTLGLEITDTHAKLCEIRVNGQSVRVTKFADIELPDGTMNDGRIQDELLLRHTLQKLVNEHKWESKFVHFAIPSQSVMVRLIKLPDVNEKELKKIIDFEISHNIHLPFEDPYYDFIKLQSNSENNELTANSAQDEKTCDVMLVAAPQELLQQYIAIIGDLNFTLLSIEIKAFSLIRLTNHCMESNADELKLLVDVTNTNCDFTIMRNGIAQLTRNVQASFTGQKPQSDALNQMFSEFVQEGLTDEGLNYEGSFNDLTGEIERFMNFCRYTLNNRDEEVKRIIVTGDIPMLDDFTHYLGNRVTSATVSIIQWPTLETRQETNKWNLAQYAVPLGLSLRGKS